MAKVEIYVTSTCPYCDRAKRIFQSKGVSFIQIDVSGDDELRKLMMGRSNGRRSVPQIFINDVHIGGSDDLVALDEQGKLDSMLA